MCTKQSADNTHCPHIVVGKSAGVNKNVDFFIGAGQSKIDLCKNGVKPKPLLLAIGRGRARPKKSS